VILVIDVGGSSADIRSTIRSLQGEYPNLYLFDQTVNNLEDAYTKGKLYALDKLDADISLLLSSYLKNNPEFIKIRIWLQKWQELIKYSFVGASGAIVNMGFFLILTRFFQLSVEYASPVAIETAIVSNFILNNIWTFKNRAVKVNLRIKFIRFHMVALIAGLVNYIVLLTLVYAIGLLDILANIMGIVSAMMVNYVLNSTWTWKKYYG